MNIHTFWEYLTIGQVSYDICDCTLGATSTFGLIITVIHFVTALVVDYSDERNDEGSLSPSTYLIFALPLLLLAASFEFIIVMQFTFSPIAFTIAWIIWLLYSLIKLFGHFSGDFYSPLYIMHGAQRIGQWMTKSQYFFQGPVQAFKASRNIRKAQQEHLNLK